MQFKIYNDGSHFVSTVVLPQGKPPVYTPKFFSDLQDTLGSMSEHGRELRVQKYFAFPSLGLSDSSMCHKDTDIADAWTPKAVFDLAYQSAVDQGLRRKARYGFIVDIMDTVFGDDCTFDIDAELGRKLNRVYVRKRRFRRKAFLHEWNYFVTFTYNDDLHDESSFRSKIRRCLCNLHTRRSWRYMGVFEHAPETGRLHFHGLFNIPEGQMLGEITEQEDYSTALHAMQTTYPNSFFTSRFGRNDFVEVSEQELRVGNTISYLLKYIEKSGERIVYSRGTSEFIYAELDHEHAVACRIEGNSARYVLFDDVFYKYDVCDFFGNSVGLPKCKQNSA